MKEEVLAINKAHETQEYNAYHTFRGRVGVIATLLMIVQTVVVLNVGEGAVVFVISALTAGMIPFAIINLDRDMRWHCAVETVAVRNEILVIQCRRCILKRTKEIPLSAIKGVEYYDDISGWRPETLYMVYSNTGFKFGLCLSDSERDTLANKITDLIRQYV